MNKEKNMSVEDSLKTVGISSKKMLTLDEASQYLGMNKSYLYKLTSSRKIPFYKPLGKMCYFNREELEEWLQKIRITPNSEIDQAATNYLVTGQK